jgi:hypothetical protein
VANFFGGSFLILVRKILVRNLILVLNTCKQLLTRSEYKIQEKLTILKVGRLKLIKDSFDN